MKLNECHIGDMVSTVYNLKEKTKQRSEVDDFWGIILAKQEAFEWYAHGKGIFLIWTVLRSKDKLWYQMNTFYRLGVFSGNYNAIISKEQMVAVMFVMSVMQETS